MNTIHVMVGNIGTGKSWTTKRLVNEDTRKNTCVVNTDSLVPMLNLGNYSPDVFTDRHRELYTHLLTGSAYILMHHGFDVIVDTAMMSKAKRKKFIDVAKSHGAQVKVYVHKTPGGLERRIAESHGDAPWDKVYEMFEKEYEEPSLDEGIDEIIDCTWRL